MKHFLSSALFGDRGLQSVDKFVVKAIAKRTRVRWRIEVRKDDRVAQFFDSGDVVQES
jgi:hypothetical protein